MKNKKLFLFSLSVATVTFFGIYGFFNLPFDANASDNLSAAEFSNPTSDSSKKKSKSLTIPLSQLTPKDIYEKFGPLTDDILQSRINSLYESSGETDTAVILTDGGISIGGLTLVDNSTNTILGTVNTDTDPNAVTIKELEIFLRNNQQEVLKIAEKQNNLKGE